jgi:hypothetical protein
MKSIQAKNITPANSNHFPFFQKESGSNFFNGNGKSFFNSNAIQAKLTVNQPGDPYEKEADAMADKVVQRLSNGISDNSKNNSNSFFNNSNTFLQRKCPGCEQEEKLQKKDKEDEQDLLNDRLQKKSIFESNAEPQDEEKNIQRKCAECEQEEKLQKKPDASSQQSSVPDIETGLSASKGSGNPLPTESRQQMESSFDADFANVRIHDDSVAVQMNKDLNAQAFTHGSDIYFNAGKYDINSKSGQHLLAHELVHTVQQGGGIRSKIQLSRLRDFADISDPQHDPSRLTDAQITATDEFKAYMDSNLIWQWKDKVTREEALLSCRLILRHLREGKSINWSSDARIFMNMARKQGGTVTQTEKMIGQDQWVPFNTSVAVADPSQLQSEFAKWLLAGGPEPTGRVDKMNCWEAVLSGAHRGGFIVKAGLVAIYNKAVDNVKKGLATFVGDTIETELRGSDEHIFDLSKPTTTEQPLRGDIIIFSKAKDHVAISLGTINGVGEHEILSLWNYDSKRPNLEKTTIETLVRGGAPKPVKFWTVKW